MTTSSVCALPKRRAGRGELPPRRLPGHFGSVFVVKFSHGTDLDLAHPFSGYSEPAADLLERLSRFAFQSVPKNQDGPLAGLQTTQPASRMRQSSFGFQHRLGWRVMVADRIPTTTPGEPAP